MGVVPGRRISWILLGLAGLIEIQMDLRQQNEMFQHIVERIADPGECPKTSTDSNDYVMNNSRKNMREYESMMRGWRGSSAGVRGI